MIDRILVPSSVHVTIGMAVLLVTLCCAGLTSWLAWRKQSLTKSAHALLILSQIVLMVQVLIGIKLLDQGQGVSQLYIHYVGGLSPLLFFILLYWLPIAKPLTKTRLAAGLSIAAWVFALMAFGIGQMYVRRGTL